MTHMHSVGRNYYALLATGLLMAVLALFPIAPTYAHEEKPNKSGTGVEINLTSNGNALVRGAQVTSVSGSDISATTNYGSSQLAWTVKTDSDTEFTANKNGATGLSQIAAGDTISFRGILDQAVSGLTVNADVVKDWSHVETTKKLSGIVSSINTTLNSFTVSHGNSTTSVQTNGDTKFTLNGNAGSFASLFINAKVKIAGMFNASSSILTATSVDIASSTKKWSRNDDDRTAWRDWIRSTFWLNWRS